MSIIVMLLWSS